MRPLQHVSHSPFDVVARLVATKAAPPCGRFLQQFAIPSLILRQSRSLAPPTKYFDNNRLPYRTTTRIAIFDSRRLLSSSRKCFEQRPPPPTPKDPIDPPLSPKFPETTPRTHEVAGSDSRVPEEDLPSHRAGQRWQLSKRVASLVDKLQSDLIIASQRLNNYTGTDYSGIEALRQEIKDRGMSLPEWRPPNAKKQHRTNSQNLPLRSRPRHRALRRRALPTSLLAKRSRRPP